MIGWRVIPIRNFRSGYLRYSVVSAHYRNIVTHVSFIIHLLSFQVSIEKDPPKNFAVASSSTPTADSEAPASSSPPKGKEEEDEKEKEEDE